MLLEINKQFKAQNTNFQRGDEVIMLSPIVDEDYYIFRVHLYKDQYLLAFPKFGTIGIGFAKEEDWNTNLPFQCLPEEIYNHIKHNKKYREIKKKDVLKAIEELRIASMVYMEFKRSE